MDGSLGSRTALMHQPYADKPDSTGVRLHDAAELRQMASHAHDVGLNVGLCPPVYASASCH